MNTIGIPKSRYQPSRAVARPIAKVANGTARLCIICALSSSGRIAERSPHAGSLAAHEVARVHVSAELPDRDVELEGLPVNGELTGGEPAGTMVPSGHSWGVPLKGHPPAPDTQRRGSSRGVDLYGRYS